MDDFYMCWVPTTQRVSRRHPDLASAEREATRLSKQLNTPEVFVLHATRLVKCTQVITSQALFKGSRE